MPREFRPDEQQRKLVLLQVVPILAIGGGMLYSLSFGLSPFIALPLAGLAFLAAAFGYLQSQEVEGLVLSRPAQLKTQSWALWVAGWL